MCTHMWLFNGHYLCGLRPKLGLHAEEVMVGVIRSSLDVMAHAQTHQFGVQQKC
jgi:hypothetical protein